MTDCKHITMKQLLRAHDDGEHVVDCQGAEWMPYAAKVASASTLKGWEHVATGARHSPSTLMTFGPLTIKEA